MYASPSWWGFTLASDKEHLEKLLKRAKRLGYLEQSFPLVSELANIAETKLIFSILHNPKHVLHQLLTSLRPLSSHQLRPRASTTRVAIIFQLLLFSWGTL